MAPRIKSPQLYQLSYRPKTTEQFGKDRAHEREAEPIVSPVYPNRSSLSRRWLESAVARVWPVRDDDYCAACDHDLCQCPVPPHPPSSEDVLEPLRRSTSGAYEDDAPADARILRDAMERMVARGRR